MSEWLSSMCSLPLCCIQARNVLGDSNSIPSFPAAYVEGLGGVPNHCWRETSSASAFHNTIAHPREGCLAYLGSVDYR